MLDSKKIGLQVQRWLDEVVIGLGLCPFAGQPVAKGLHHIAVLDDQSINSALAALKIECEKLMTADPKELETSLLILPYLFGDFLDFMSEANELLTDNDWSMNGFWSEIYSNHAISMITMDITVAASSYLIFLIYQIVKNKITKYDFIKYFLSLFSCML